MNYGRERNLKELAVIDEYLRAHPDRGAQLGAFDWIVQDAADVLEELKVQDQQKARTSNGSRPGYRYAPLPPVHGTR